MFMQHKLRRTRGGGGGGGGDECSRESEKKTLLSKRVPLFLGGGDFIRYMATCLVSFLSQDCL